MYDLAITFDVHKYGMLDDLLEELVGKAALHLGAGTMLATHTRDIEYRFCDLAAAEAARERIHQKFPDLSVEITTD